MAQSSSSSSGSGSSLGPGPGSGSDTGPGKDLSHAIAGFHPASRAWFEGKFGTPTPAQAEAWAHISAGRHTLIAAPTGSGKTLAAFYAAIDALLKRGQAQQLGEGVQIIYVSPLKALSNDIRKNLEEPLDGIAEQLHLQGQAPVDIRIAVRSGDTPPSERARMAKKPPHILVTTPESLYLLLTSASGRAMLATARSLIVDEIHALLGDKRGSHLALSMERLEHLIMSRGGEPLQRIGLSATQKPIELVARYLVGSSADEKIDTKPNKATSNGNGNEEATVPPCEIVDSGFRRELDLRIEVPSSPLSALMSNEVWDELYTRLVDLINSHDTTLVFVNTRRLSERLALALAERLGDDVVCSHHGSMSKDHRHSAEQRLKAGKLKVLVATASMELGIDVGSVDLVVQFSSPKSIATYLQRVGRSGHSIHGTPKGILFPLTRDDLIEAAAMLRSIRQGELDAIVMPEKPLDILAQQIVAEVSAQVHDTGREPTATSVEEKGLEAESEIAEPLQRYTAPLSTALLPERRESDAQGGADPRAESEVQNGNESGEPTTEPTVFQPLDQALAAMHARNGNSRSKDAPTDALAVTPAPAEVREQSLAQARANLGIKAKPKRQKYPRRTRQPADSGQSQDQDKLDEQKGFAGSAVSDVGVPEASSTPDPVQLAQNLAAKVLGAGVSNAVQDSHFNEANEPQTLNAAVRHASEEIVPEEHAAEAAASAKSLHELSSTETKARETGAKETELEEPGVKQRSAQETSAQEPDANETNAKETTHSLSPTAAASSKNIQQVLKRQGDFAGRLGAEKSMSESSAAEFIQTENNIAEDSKVQAAFPLEEPAIAPDTESACLTTQAQLDEDDALDSWGIDELYQLVTRAYPYRDLTLEEFEQTLQMVAEGYTSRRGKRGAHLHLDAINRRLRPRRGANLISLTNGGAIPDMFDYQVVLDPEDTVVGSLNEDFAIDSLPGDVFTLGTHAWQIIRVDGLKVRVRDAQGMSPTVPFWFGEGPGRTVELSTAVSDFRRSVGDKILDESPAAAVSWCRESIGLPSSAATQIVDYLQGGMNALGAMPTRETIVMERFFDEVGDMHVVIHSPFGSRINRGWGLALRKRFCKSFNFELQAAANEDSIVISLGSVHSFPLDDVFRYLQTTTVRDVLIQALLDSPMFEVRWRWNATRSLAIQRNRSGKRVPPQFQRMDAEDLIAHVFPDQIACAENLTGRRDVPEHPLIDQTIHDCLTEAMDIDALIELIGKVERQELTLIAKDLREPSPFAQEIINARPYAFLDDAPAEERRTNAIRNRSWADPAEAKDYSLLDTDAIARVREEAWPLVHNAEELHDALQTLGYVTAAEFADHSYERWRDGLEKQGRLQQLSSHGQGLYFASEDLPRFKALFPEECVGLVLPAFLEGVELEPEAALRDLLRGRLEGLGPVTAARLAGELCLSVAKIEAALTALEVEGFVFQGQFTRGGQQSELEWCERRLLQRIHRYTIESHRKAIKPVSLQTFALYLFEHHGVSPVREDVVETAERDAAAMQRLVAAPHRKKESAYYPEAPGPRLAPALDGQTQLQHTLALLDGLSAPAANWESDLYPSRVADYDPGWLDVLCISGRVSWGRTVQASAAQKALHKGKSGPVKTTPIAIMSRANLDLWQALAREQLRQLKEPGRRSRIKQGAQANAKAKSQAEVSAEAAEAAPRFSALGLRIESDLVNHGASFFDQILSRTGLLKAQLEEGLAELVGGGRVTSDSFTGLRALLTPAKKASGRRRGRSPMFGIEDAGRWSLIDTFQVSNADLEPQSSAQRAQDLASSESHRLSAGTGWNALDDEQLERLIAIYLNRWGVLFRGILEREMLAPPWRVLLRVLRRMELRGSVRGGRFVAGVGGEQFAFQESVDGLRKKAKSLQAEGSAQPVYHSLAASDPLNLLNLIMPKRKLAKLLNNRVLFEDGVPIAVVEAGEVKFLREVPAQRQWALQQALVQKHFPPRLRSYLGSGKTKLTAH